MITTTEKARKLIPRILKASDQPLSESQLMENLAKHMPELKKGDELRNGVLRGILNKLDTKPVENLGIKKTGGKVYYYYLEGSSKEMIWNHLVEQFISEVNKKKILTIDYMTDDAETLKFAEEASKLLKQLQELKQK